MQVFPRTRLPGQSLRERFGPRATAVDERNLPRAFINQVAERFLAHFAGADDEDVLVVEALKDAFGKLSHGDTGNADALLLDRRFGGDALCYSEGSLKGSILQRAG